MYDLDDIEVIEKSNSNYGNKGKIQNCLIMFYPKFLTQREVMEKSEVKNSAQVHQKLMELINDEVAIRFKANNKNGREVFFYGISPEYAKFFKMEDAENYEKKLKEKNLI